jgi:ADP-ribosylglycohydrolase
MPKNDILTPPAEPTGTYDRLFRSIAGGLIGGATADALGWITEFVRGPEHLKSLYKTDYVRDYRSWQKVTGGRFNAYVDHINRGEYSDDTQLTLAVARSLMADGSFDVEHFSKTELPLWLGYARGGGRTVSAAAKAIQRRSARWNSNFFTFKTRAGESTYRSAGANGAAMRVAPIALANVSDQEKMVRGVWESTITTHGHPRAIVGALAQAEAVRLCVFHHRHGVGPHHILEDVREFVSAADVPQFPGVAEWLHEWNADPSISFATEWEAAKSEIVDGIQDITKPEVPVSPSQAMERFGCLDPATRGSGTGTVLAGFALFYSFADDFRSGVEAAVNQLGTDTDTIGSFVGTLIGAFMGFDEIPRDWAIQLQDYEYFMRVATELAAISSGHGMGNAALLPKRGTAAKEPDLVQLVKDKNISAKDVVYHELFGRGVVESVDSQNLRRKDGARAIFARVQFYIGQSAKFRYLEFPRRGRKADRHVPTAHDLDQASWPEPVQ